MEPLSGVNIQEVLRRQTQGGGAGLRMDGGQGTEIGNQKLGNSGRQQSITNDTLIRPPASVKNTASGSATFSQREKDAEQQPDIDKKLEELRKKIIK